MKNCILALSEFFLLLCTGAIFIILFAIIHQTLKQIFFFGKKACVVVAICVSLLCITGLHQHFFATTDSSATTGQGDTLTNEFNFLLLPYTALTLAILLTLLLLFLFKTFSSHGSKRLSKYRERRIEKLRHCDKSDEESHIRK